MPVLPFLTHFSLAVPAEVRMLVAAVSEKEARAIIAAMIGGGTWEPAALARFPVRFAVRVT